MPEQRQEALAEPRALVTFGQDRVELGRGRIGRVGLEDAGVGLQDLAQRPEGDALPVRKASALAPGDELGLGVDVGAELGDDPALAEPGLADHRDELDRPAATVLSKMPFRSARSISRPMNGRVVGPGEVGAEPRPGRLRVEDPHRLDLPFSIAGSSSS